MNGTTVTLTSKNKEAKVGDLMSFSVERAENGFTMTCRHKEKPRKMNEPYDYDEGREMLVFPTVDALIAGIKSELGAEKKEK